MNAAMDVSSDLGQGAERPGGRRVVLTRPAASTAVWTKALQASGYATTSLPLLEVVPEPDASARDAARAHLNRWQAVMFVSGNAVRYFLHDATPAILDGAPQVRAWAPGPATAHGLQAWGWPADRLDGPDAHAAQFDSEALWARVAPQARPGVRVLIVRGGDASGKVAGRAWLAQQIVAAGGVVDQLVVYRRQAPTWSQPMRQAAEDARADGSIWIFSSAEAARNLPALGGIARWDGVPAVVTHERIAAAARALGFDVRAVTRPHPRDVVAALDGLRAEESHGAR